MLLVKNARMLYWREHPNSRNNTEAVEHVTLMKNDNRHEERLGCRSEIMVLSIWKHNFVCCMPETKSNVIPLAYLPMANEKTAEFWLLL